MEMRDVFPFVYEECPGAPEPAMLRAVRGAAMELFRESRVYVEYLDPIVLAANTNEYELEIDDNYKVAEIKQAWVGGREVPVYSPNELSRMYGDWTDDTAASLTAITQKNPSVVNPFPIPTVAGDQLKLRVAIYPSYDSLEIRDDIFDIYVETIACGAKARLQMQPGKPWTNPQQAAFNAAYFTRGKNAARVRGNRDGAPELKVQMVTV
jgi:hypothetical protein